MAGPNQIQQSCQPQLHHQIACPYPDNHCIHQLFEQHAQRNPNAVALIHGQQQLSYAELDLRANVLAAMLLQRGVRAGSRIGVGIERSFEMIIALLAVLKTGGAYVPLDPAYPSARLQYMMAHSELELVLTQSSLVDHWGETTVLAIDSLAGQLAASNIAEPLPAVDPKGLAYVIYTSGSTGTPKGVMGHHQGLCNLAQVQNQYLKAAAGSRVLQFASLSFDAATWEITMALGTGAALVLAHRDELTSATALAQLIIRHNVTHATISPTMLALLDPQKCPLQVVISAGEACSQTLVQNWASHCMFVNAYGPTEATVCATMKVCQSDTLVAPSIGKPISNHRVYILDENQQMLPPGQSGEIFIAGVGVAKGYLNDPSLSVEKFLSDPFFADDRMYRSGDRGFYNDNGEIEFQGRIDQQIKLNGYRIELGEIEAALSTYPEVKSVAVILRQDDGFPSRLVAYIGSDAAITSGKLRDFLCAQLPEHMIPSAFVLMDSLPLTPNGKIDRHNLPMPATREGLSNDYVAPQGPIEIKLVQIWRDVLNQDLIGVNDNFFELGGHSLLAIKMLAQISTELHAELPLSALFNAPTVLQMADLLSQSKPTRVLSSTIVATGTKGKIPLSAEQQQIWFASEVCDKPYAFNMPICLDLEGPLDLESLKQSLATLCMRHDALRTRFSLKQGQPMQQVEATSNFKLTLVPIYALPAFMQQKEIDKRKNKETTKPFDLLAGPLFRGTLLALGEHKHTLLLSTHHLVFDGWSHTLFLQELFALYQAIVTEQPLTLPAPEIQFTDYVLWKQNMLQGARLEQLTCYWRDQLQGHHTKGELPIDFPRPAFRSFAGASTQIVIPHQLIAPLQALARQQQASTYMTLLSAFYVLLMAQTGQDDFVVGGTVANRNNPATQKLIGVFVNMVPLRINMTEYSDFTALINGVKAVVLAADQHQELPFEQLVRCLAIDHDPSRMPLFQSVFRYETSLPSSSLGQTGLTAHAYVPDSNCVKLDLEIVAVESSNEILMCVQYGLALFSPAHINNLLEDYIKTLECLLSDPLQPLTTWSHTNE